MLGNSILFPPPQVDLWPRPVSRVDLCGGDFALRLHQQLCPRQPGPSALSEIPADLQQQVSHKLEDYQDWYRYRLSRRLQCIFLNALLFSL